MVDGIVLNVTQHTLHLCRKVEVLPFYHTAMDQAVVYVCMHPELCRRQTLGRHRQKLIGYSLDRSGEVGLTWVLMTEEGRNIADGPMGKWRGGQK